MTSRSKIRATAGPPPEWGGSRFATAVGRRRVVAHPRPMVASTRTWQRVRSLAGAFAALAATSLLASACVLDWERDPGTGGGGPSGPGSSAPSSGPGGGNVCNAPFCDCVPGEPCTYDCVGSDACTVICDGATSCTVTCLGSGLCAVDCTGADTCNVVGAAGVTSVHCDDDVACEVTCGVGLCELDCTNGAQCSALCQSSCTVSCDEDSSCTRTCQSPGPACECNGCD